METVKFYGRSTAKTLTNGREVKIGLSDDGMFWGLRFGLLDDPNDSVSFALSAEALEAAEECIGRLRRLAREGDVQRWVWKVALADPAENSPSDMAAAGGLPPLSAPDDPTNPDVKPLNLLTPKESSSDE